jgi:inorganic pyrophosphatase
MHRSLEKLPTWDNQGRLNVVVETPKGSRNKLAWNEEYGMIELRGVLPAGAVFPFDFGFLPSTLGQDGDPLDLLVLMDDATYPGVLVPCRLLGVVEAEQTEDGKTERNDRLIAVAANSRSHARYASMQDVDENVLHEIEHFFRSYNEAKGKEFRVLGRGGVDRAREIVEAAGTKN